MIFKQKKGFTLIEGLVALLIFCILVVTFYKIFTQTTLHMADGKQRRAAVSLANERMEHYRNLAYANVGTTTNAPFGSIVADEKVTVNDISFRFITTVFYVDDAFGGKAAGGVDVIPNDYKRVSVSVIWDQCVNTTAFPRGTAEYGAECSSKRVKLISQFVPPGGLETIDSGGILSINVLDAEANAISDAILTIYDSVRDETFAVQTDSTGNYLYIGAPACEGCYEIALAKGEYETLSTKVSPSNQMTLVGDVSYFPRFVHQSVSDGLMTSMSFIMKKYSDLIVTTEDPFGVAIPGIDFAVHGGRVMGTNLNDNPLYTEMDVYSFHDETVTDGDGKLDIRTDTNNDDVITSADHVNPGPFFFDLDDIEKTDYTFWKMTPSVDIDARQISVNADETVDAKMVLMDNDYKSVFIRVINSDGVPVSGANVYLYDNQETSVYEVEQQTDAYGYVYFPARSLTEPYDIYPLLAEDMEYEYVITAGGYELYSGMITIEDDKLYRLDGNDSIILTTEE